MTHAVLPPAPSMAHAAPAGLGTSTLRAGRIVVGIAIGLTGLGLVMLYSASSAQGMVRGVSTPATYQLTRQIQWVFLGGMAAWGAATISLEWLRKLGRPLLLAALVLLAITLFAGGEINNSRRWIRILGLSVQPSEILKLAVLLYLADRLCHREEAAPFGERVPLGALLAPVGLGAVLVLVEPDLGTSLFIVAEAVVLLALAGIRPTRVLPFALTTGPFLLLYGYTRFAHVRRRLAGPGSQAEEAIVAIGSGGLLGQGLGEGTHKFGYVPEANTDFIFAVLGEELGFLGTAAVVLAFMALVWYGRRIAWNARVLGLNAYYLAAGAVFLVAFQALINIAVATAVAPTKGISLPFISMGGSNLVIVSVAVGLLYNVARRTAAEAGDDPWA